MVHICNFCPRKVFDKNVVLMFHRSGDDITIYVPYNGISENYSCRSFRFGGYRIFDNYLGLDTITILRLTCRVTDRILVFIILVSSSILKQLRDAKLLRSSLSHILSFTVFFLVFFLFCFFLFLFFFFV